MGFDLSILSTRRVPSPSDDDHFHVSVRMRFRGKPPLRDVIAQLDDIRGVTRVSVTTYQDDPG